MVDFCKNFFQIFYLPKPALSRYHKTHKEAANGLREQINSII